MLYHIVNQAHLSRSSPSPQQQIYKKRRTHKRSDYSYGQITLAKVTGDEVAEYEENTAVKEALPQQFVGTDTVEGFEDVGDDEPYKADGTCHADSDTDCYRDTKEESVAELFDVDTL